MVTVSRAIITVVVLALAAPCLAGSKTRTSRFEYDASGFLIREIVEPDDSALCLVTTYVPDSHGNRASATTRNCNGTNTSGVIEAAAPTGDPVFLPRTSGATYAAGSDVNGAWIEGQFPTTLTNALLQSETRTYDPRFGGVLTLTGPNNLPTIWRYDSFGRKQSETRADGTVSNWFYERCADVGGCPQFARYRVRVTATGSPTTSTYYDSRNREVRTETQGFNGTLVFKDTRYDNLGRVEQVSRSYYAGATPAVTTFTYDPLGRVVQTDDPPTPSGQVRTITAYNNVVTATTWTTTVTVSNAGSGTNMPAGAAQTRSTTKNSQDQVVQVKDTQDKTLTYTYDELGNLKTTKDALDNVTTLSYDLRGRKIQTIDPDMGTWTYAYNAASDLMRQVDAKIQTTTMTYDKLARTTNRTEPDLVSTWTYDSCTKGVGKLCQATASNGYSRTLVYDPVGRPQTLNASIDTAYAVATTYVQSGIHKGKIDTLTYPTGFGVRQVYNSFGYLAEVRVANPGASNAFPVDGTLLWQATAMSASGKVTTEVLGGNAGSLTQTRMLDPIDRLSSVVASGTGGTVQNLSYTYDTLGNVTQRVNSVDAVTENFAYDTLSRLISASGPGLITRSFDYNALGNMIFKSDVGSGTYTYPASGAGSVRPHAVSSIAGTVNGIANPTFAYDPNGNLTSGLGRTLTYMSFNLPLTLSSSAATYTYTYSPEHERVKLITQLATGTQTSIYLHPDGAGALLYEKEIKPDTTLEHKHYVNAGTQLVGVYVTKSVYVGSDAKQMRYYHGDGLGSIMAISNEAGARIEGLAYEAFGKRRFTNGTADPNNTLFGITTDRGFTEHEHLDELGLIHMNGRVYDPLLARFMTPDPDVPYQFNLQSFNRYSYARNNPLRNIDPSGFCDAYDGCYDPGEPFESSSSYFSYLNLWNQIISDIFANLTAPAVSKEDPSSSDPFARSSSLIPTLPVVPPQKSPVTGPVLDIPSIDPGKGANKTLQLADAGAAAAQNFLNDLRNQEQCKMGCHGIAYVEGRPMSSGEALALSGIALAVTWPALPFGGAIASAGSIGRTTLVADLMTAEGGLRLSATAASKLATRPEVSSLAIRETILGGTRVADPQGVAGRFMYSVDAASQRGRGTLEVLVNEIDRIIEHAVYKSGR